MVDERFVSPDVVIVILLNDMIFRIVIEEKIMVCGDIRIECVGRDGIGVLCIEQSVGMVDEFGIEIITIFIPQVAVWVQLNVGAVGLAEVAVIVVERIARFDYSHVEKLGAVFGLLEHLKVLPDAAFVIKKAYHIDVIGVFAYFAGACTAVKGELHYCGVVSTQAIIHSMRICIAIIVVSVECAKAIHHDIRIKRTNCFTVSPDGREGICIKTCV
jgi:hypothetical protein